MATRKRTHPISTARDELVLEAFYAATTKAELIRELVPDFDSCRSPGNYKLLNKRLNELGLDWAEKPKNLTPQLVGLTASVSARTRPLTQYLVDLTNSDLSISSSRLRKRLIAEGIFSNECSICGLGSEWQGKPITHQLDHINGNPADHRLSNLRIVCANCHTQTDTYCGRNKKRKDRE